jgi:hypothetical protein
MRRVATVLGAVMVMATSVAMASALAPGMYLHASKSSHGHYALQLSTECLTTGCRRTTEISAEVEIGKPGKTTGKCPNAIFAIPSASLKKDRFSGSGQFVLAGHDVTISINGVVKSIKKITGTVTGPKACGGADHSL